MASERDSGNTNGGGASDGGLLGAYGAMPGAPAGGPAFTGIGDTGLDAIRAWPSWRRAPPAFALSLRGMIAGLLDACTVVLVEVDEAEVLEALDALDALDALPASWPVRDDEDVPASQWDTILLNIELVRPRPGAEVD